MTYDEYLALDDAEQESLDERYDEYLDYMDARNLSGAVHMYADSFETWLGDQT